MTPKKYVFTSQKLREVGPLYLYELIETPGYLQYFTKMQDSKWRLLGTYKSYENR